MNDSAMNDPEVGARTFMGVVMIVLAAVGAGIVAHAVDDPMLVFGYSLIIFGVAYVFGLVRQHFDAIQHDQAPRVVINPAEQPATAA